MFDPQAVHVAPESVLPYPAKHWPALEPPQLLLFGSHVTHAESLTTVLYLPAAQAVQVTPESVEPYPGAQLPADGPPQPLSLPEHVIHALLPAVVLYLHVSQAVHVAPGIGAVELV